MKMLKAAALGLALLLTLTACAADPAAGSPSPTPEPSELPATAPVSLPQLEALRELVDWQADDYLAGTCSAQAEALEHLALRAFCTGLELEDGNTAAMALFTVLGTPHVAGAQYTIVLLLDEDMAPIGQTAVAADSVEFQQLDSSHVLFLRAGRSTGVSSYDLTVLKATSSGWEDQSEHSGLVRDDLHEPYYSFSMGDLWVFENTSQGLPMTQPMYRQYCVLRWMGEEQGGFQQLVVPENG